MRYIIGEEKLLAIFGAWPSFHDAEVLVLSQERMPQGFDIVMVINTFDVTTEVDAHGRHKLEKHTHVTLRFVDCDNVALSSFSHQNILFSLKISEERRLTSERPFIVQIESSCGLEGRFNCSEIEVVDTSPWIPDDSYTNRN